MESLISDYRFFLFVCYLVICGNKSIDAPLHIRQEENPLHVERREVSKWMGGIPAMEMEYCILNVFVSREKGGRFDF